MTSTRLKLAAMKAAGHDPVGELADVLREIERDRSVDAAARKTATAILIALKQTVAVATKGATKAEPGNLEKAIVNVGEILAQALGGAATGAMLRDLVAAVRPHLDEPLTGQSKADHQKLLEHLDEMETALEDLNRETTKAADSWHDLELGHVRARKSKKPAAGRTTKKGSGRPVAGAPIGPTGEGTSAMTTTLIPADRREAHRIRETREAEELEAIASAFAAERAERARLDAHADDVLAWRAGVKELQREHETLAARAAELIAELRSVAERAHHIRREAAASMPTITTVRVRVVNPDRRPNGAVIERAGHRFAPGETVELSVRPDRLLELRAAAGLRVEPLSPLPPERPRFVPLPSAVDRV